MQYTPNQHKSIQVFTYIHTKENNIRYTPQGLTGLCPSVRFIRTCVEYTESYYDKHTNTTEIRPDYYIYTLERSICLIASIINNIRYTPQGLTGLCPSVRFIRTCVEYTESYYDKHTNTTEIRPDYYIYTLERSICLIINIMINIRYISRCVMQISNSVRFNYTCDFIRL